MISMIDTSQSTISQSLKSFFSRILESGAADAVLVPSRVGDTGAVTPCLISRADGMDRVEPLGPAFFVNAGRMVSRLAWKPSGRRTAVWLRPCEIRAFVELTKLKQGSRDEVIILGMDCPGALSRQDYETWQARHPDEADAETWARGQYAEFMGQEKNGNGDGMPAPAPACRVCDTPFPVNADLSVLLTGADLDHGIPLRADTPKGEAFLRDLSLPKGEAPADRETVITGLQSHRETAFQQMADRVTEQTDAMDKLSRFFSACINCYNCRNVCPACYCRECVFNTDLFVHDPVQYHQWAGKWGQVTLPYDTLFYHLTRLAHMSLSCVGCGQCTQACPAGIPLSDLFITLSRRTQAAFNYVPGRDDSEPLPLSVFDKDEFQEIVGMADGEGS